MPELLQDAVVTLVALGAAWIVFRRVFGLVASRGGASPACDSCPSAAAHGHRPPAAGDGEVRPLTLVRERRP